MASSLNMAMYDYNGVIFAFGVVRGLSNVKSVRMYVSSSDGNTYQYCSSQVYTQSEARINTSQNSTPCFLFNVRTDRDRDSTIYPTQIRYDIIDENNDRYGTYKVSFHFYSNTSGTGSPINSSPLTPGTGDVRYQMHNSITTPAISWDTTTQKITVTTAARGDYRCMIEVRRKNRNKVNTAFTADVKDYAYTVVMKNLEGGKYWEAIPDTSLYGTPDGVVDEGDRCRYRYKYGLRGTANCRAIVAFDSGAGFSVTNRNSYMTMIGNIFSELTDLTGISFTVNSVVNSDYSSTSYYNSEERLVYKYGYGWVDEGEDFYDIIIRIGNSSSMKGDWTGEGMWNTWRWDDWPEGGIATSIAQINISNSTSFESVSHVLHEEIYQSFGMGADNYEHPLSIHWDPEYANPDSYSITDPYDGVQWDAEVMNFWQSQDMRGWTNIDLINNMDTPCTMFKEYSSSGVYEFDLSGLVADDYYVSAWIAGEKSNPSGGGTSKTASGTSDYTYWHGGWDDSPYSLHNQIEISVTGNRPTNWSWTASNGTATTAQTSKAYTAVTNNGKLTDFSYLVWNDLVDKVQEFMVYKNISDSTLGTARYGYSSNSTMKTMLAGAKMTSSDKAITAKRFNIVRFCIGSMNSTGLTDYSQGDTIYGWYFTRLTDRLNAIT